MAENGRYVDYPQTRSPPSTTYRWRAFTPRSPTTLTTAPKLTGSSRRIRPSSMPCAKAPPQSSSRSFRGGSRMAPKVRFYTDEHVAKAVVHGLRQRGVDVLTVADASMLGAADEEHLASARSENRVLFTQDPGRGRERGSSGQRGQALDLHAVVVEDGAVAYVGVPLGDDGRHVPPAGAELRPVPLGAAQHHLEKLEPPVSPPAVDAEVVIEREDPRLLVNLGASDEACIGQ
jgi:hypothetical protein